MTYLCACGESHKILTRQLLSWETSNCTYPSHLGLGVAGDTVCKGIHLTHGSVGIAVDLGDATLHGRAVLSFVLGGTGERTAQLQRDATKMIRERKLPFTYSNIDY